MNDTNPPEPRRLRIAAWRAAASLYELWMLLPLWLWAHHIAYVSGDGAGRWLAAAAALSALAAAASVRVRTVWRQLLLSLAGAAAAGAIAFGADGGAGAIVGAALLFAAAVFAFTIPSRMGRQGWYWAGVIVFFVVSAVYRIVPGWNEYGALLTGGGILCLAVALFAINAIHLRGAVLSDDRQRPVPEALRRHNRIFVGSILVFMLLLAAGLGSLIVNAVKTVVGGTARWIIHFLMSLTNRAQPPEPQEPPPSLVPDVIKPEEPSRVGHVLEIIFIIFGVTLLAAIVALLAYAIYRHYRRFFRALFARLAALFGRSAKEAAGDGFTDEESSLFSLEDAMRGLRKNRLARLLTGDGRPREPRYEELGSNKERARFLYRRWLRAQFAAGYGAKPHLTPEETVRDALHWREERAASGRGPRAATGGSGGAEQPLIDAYYRARYGDDDPTDEQVAAVRQQLDAGKR